LDGPAVPDNGRVIGRLHHEGTTAMKTYCVRVLALGLAITAAPAAQEKTPKQAAKEQADVLAAAALKGDYRKVAELAHPNLVKLAGGRDKVAAAAEAAAKQSKAQGAEVSSLNTREPGAPVPAGVDLYIVVPYRLVMTSKGTKSTLDAIYVGVSPDRGKT
jgi:Asp-tRNA(Asn)/Glu-tRNA(Gln) amidotransferase A subunit family amidase